MRECKCGCGEAVRGKRVFVNKEHQLAWMSAGGAREIGALQSVEAKALGGHVAGKAAAESGALAERGKLGAERAHEIAVEYRRRTGRRSSLTRSSRWRRWLNVRDRRRTRVEELFGRAVGAVAAAEASQNYMSGIARPPDMSEDDHARMAHHTSRVAAHQHQPAHSGVASRTDGPLNSPLVRPRSVPGSAGARGPDEPGCPTRRGLRSALSVGFR